MTKSEYRDLAAKMAMAVEALPESVIISHVDIAKGTDYLRIILSDDSGFDWSGGKLVRASSYTCKESDFHGVRVQHFITTKTTEEAL